MRASLTISVDQSHRLFHRCPQNLSNLGPGIKVSSMNSVLASQGLRNLKTRTASHLNYELNVEVIASRGFALLNAHRESSQSWTMRLTPTGNG